MINGVLVVDASNSDPGSQVQVRDDYCADETGRGVDHGLTIRHWSNLMTPLNGIQQSSPTTWRQYEAWMVPGYPTKAHLSIPGMPSVGASATRLLAQTNPGRANVSLPVFIAEMRDLPHAIKSIKDIGDQLIRKKVPRTRDVAGQLLSWEFGWRPLLSDLRKITNFSDMIQKRSREIERLFSKGGLKRRLTLFEGNADHSQNLIIASSLGELVYVRQDRTTTTRRWGTVRWRPSAMPPKGPNDVTRLAMKAVFGLSIQAEDVWNILPWTWLIDWSSNVGEYLAAHSNRIPCTASVPNIMTRTQTNINWKHLSPNWVTGGEGVATYETLERALSSGTVEANLPFLSSRQLSILGSLAITRFRGGWRF